MGSAYIVVWKASCDALVTASLFRERALVNEDGFLPVVVTCLRAVLYVCCCWCWRPRLVLGLVFAVRWCAVCVIIMTEALEPLHSLLFGARRVLAQQQQPATTIKCNISTHQKQQKLVSQRQIVILAITPRRSHLLDTELQRACTFSEGATLFLKLFLLTITFCKA